ncbi:MAG: tetratricopeptide repeat protein, partial [Lentisphaeria bacterium]
AKAADAFQRYADLEANPKYNDDLLDARFLAAEQLMSVSASEAIVRFQALLNRFAAGGARGLNLTTATAKRVQENATAFLGWAYDLAGEAMRPEIDELNARQAAARADSQAAAELRQKADSAIKAAQLDQEKARSDYAETEKTLRAAATADAGLTAAPAGANELEQKLVREKAQERQKQLSGSRLKNLRDGLAGEKLDLENLRSATRAARSAVEQRLGDLQARDKALREKLQVLAAQQRRLETDLRLAEAEATTAQRALATAQAGQERSQTTLSEAKAAQKAARTPAARRQADQQRSLAARALLTAERAVRDASTAAARVAGPEPLQRLATWKKNLATVKQEHGQRQAALREVERNSRLEQAERSWQDSRLAWITTALKRNAMSAGLLEKGGLAAWDSSSELAAATTADLKALRAATDQRLALADLRIAQAKEDMAGAEERIRRDQAVVKETDTAIQPVLAKINVFKKQARDQFQAYLTQYPQGKHAPDAMARIGTILLDERQFDAAATILNELAAKYPDSKAVSRANYSLGRARLETNQPAEAAKAFQRVLAQAQTQPAGNLDYIADKMLAAGHPQLALAAAQELKRRSDDPKNPDRARLASLRETILFRTAAAALQCQRPADTITDLETLLREKPSSSYFFEAKLLLANARLAATPPNPEGAQRDVADVVQYATDPVLTNRGLVLMGEALAAAPSRENLQQAAARYQQVVLLADPAVAANRPLLEQAVYESARLFSRLGDTANRDRMVKKYQDDWPTGRFAALITKLPAADFPPPPPPAAK